MTAVEIKGNFLNFLASIENPNLLATMLATCIQLAREEDADIELPPHVFAELKKAVRLSYDEANLIPHEAVQKEVKTWFKMD